MTKPSALIFDGQDGTGKTTQGLLTGLVFEKLGLKVAYFSFPVYETVIGRTLGRCLDRWGPEQEIELPSPEAMGVLFAFNRLETLPSLKLLRKKGYLPLLNRGYYANLVTVARKILEEGIDWEGWSSKEKANLINTFSELDGDLIHTLSSEGEIVNLFLHLKADESLKSSREKSRFVLKNEPDRHETWFELQALAGQLYKEVAEGKIPGHKAELIRAIRLDEGGPADLKMINEIKQTAQGVAGVIAPYLRMDEDELYSVYLREIDQLGDGVRTLTKGEGEVDFEFRKLTGPVDQTISCRLMERLRRTSREAYYKVLESDYFDREGRVVRKRSF